MQSSEILNNLFHKYSVSPAGQELFLEHAVRFKLRDKQILLDIGQVCRAVWLVEEGCIKMAANNDGRAVNLNFALGGDFITSLESLRNDVPSEFYIKACGPSTVIAFKKMELQSLYKLSGEIAGFGRSILEQLLSEQQEHANLFKLKTPVERYRFIMEKRPSLLQKITMTQLASYLGISRETLTRVRRSV